MDEHVGARGEAARVGRQTDVAVKLLDPPLERLRRRAERGRACARRDRRRRGAVRDAGRESPRRPRSRPARRRKLAARRRRRARRAGVSTGGGAPLTSTAAANSTASATTLSPSRLRPTPGGVSPRSSRGRTNMWWIPPQASATQTSPILTSSVFPYEVVQRSESSGRRWIDTNVPAARSTPIRKTAMREKRRNAARRRSRRERPDDDREGQDTADPEHRRHEVHPVRDLGERRRVRLRSLVARERVAPDEHEGEQERRPAQERRVEHPCEHEDREADPEPEASSRGTRSRSASTPRTATGRRRAGRRPRPGARSPSGSRSPRCPVLSARNAPSVPRRWTRRSTRGSTARGRTRSRIPTTPIISASETKSAQRATSSRHVTPDAPTASVGGGGVTPTPKVKTPFPTCPSAEIDAPAHGVRLALHGASGSARA